jgi:hypothetical protein
MADDDLEDKVKKAKEALDKAAEPNAAWESISKEATEAAPNYLKLHKGGKKISDENYEKEFNTRAKSYLNSLGIDAKKQGNEFYGQMMRTWVSRLGGEQRSRLEEALKAGDELTVASIMQQAYQVNVQEAKVSTAISNIENSKPNIKIGVYKGVAEDLGGKGADYLKVVGQEQLTESYRYLAQKKSVLKHYRPAA